MPRCQGGLVCLGFLGLCAAAWPATVEAADWPQWGGCIERNMVCDAERLPDHFIPGKKRPSGGGIDPATTENVKWAVLLGSFAYGNPTVAGGRVFVGTDDLLLQGDARLKRTKGGMVKCFDAEDGRLLWQLVTPHRGNGGLPKGSLYGHQFLGTCSSPAVDGDRVFVVTNACELVCLDADGLADGNDGPFRAEGQYMVGPGKKPVELKPTDADIVWRLDMIEQLGVCPHDTASGSPLLLGELLYVNTSNGVDQPHKKVLNPLAPSLIAVDKKTGRLAATDGEEIGRRLWHAQWSSPSAGVVNGRTLVFLGGGDGVCYAFEALKTLPEKPAVLRKVWSYDCNPPEYRFRDGKPIPYYDGDRRKHRGNKNDGKYLGPSQIIATPVFYKNRVYVAIGQDPAHGRGRGMLHCIDATKSGDITTSGRVWTYDGLDRSISTVTIAGGLLYVPDIAGKLHCLDADTGKPYWVHDMKAEAWGSPLVADGKIYLGNHREFLVLAAGKRRQVLDKIRLGSAVYSSPIAVDGVLYVTSQRYLWAVAATSGGR